MLLQVPLPREKDEAYLQPCFKNHCSVPEAVAELTPCKLTVDPKDRANKPNLLKSNSARSVVTNTRSGTSNWGLNGSPPTSVPPPVPKQEPAMRTVPLPSSERTSSPSGGTKSKLLASNTEPTGSSDIISLLGAASNSVQEVWNQSGKLSFPPTFPNLLDPNTWRPARASRETSTDKGGSTQGSPETSKKIADLGPFTEPGQGTNQAPGYPPPVPSKAADALASNSPPPSSDSESNLLASFLASVMVDTSSKYADGFRTVKELAAPPSSSAAQSGRPASPADGTEVEVMTGNTNKLVPRALGGNETAAGKQVGYGAPPPGPSYPGDQLSPDKGWKLEDPPAFDSTSVGQAADGTASEASTASAQAAPAPPLLEQMSGQSRTVSDHLQSDPSDAQSGGTSLATNNLIPVENATTVASAQLEDTDAGLLNQPGSSMEVETSARLEVPEVTEIKTARSELNNILDQVRSNTDVAMSNMLLLSLKDARNELQHRLDEVSQASLNDHSVASAVREANIVVDEINASYF
eukprot:gene13822-19739_t